MLGCVYVYGLILIDSVIFSLPFEALDRRLACMADFFSIGVKPLYPASTDLLILAWGSR